MTRYVVTACTSPHSIVRFMVPLAILALIGPGCTAGEGQGHFSSGPSNTVIECETRDDRLVKPEGPSQRHNPFLSDSDDSNYGFSKGAFHFPSARRHMRSQTGHQSWLHPGEPFIIDIGHRVFGFGDLDVRMMVLVNYEPVPFAVERVDAPDEFPSREELDLESSENLETSVPLQFDNGKPVNFTLAVPPSSFSEGEGAYDMRVVLIPDKEPKDREGVQRRPLSTDGFAYRVYYGGCQSVDERPDRIESETIPWTAPDKQYVAASNELFLAPPTSAYDWKNQRQQKAKLHQTLRLEDPESKELTLYSLLNHSDRKANVDTDKIVYILFENRELIDTFEAKPAYIRRATRKWFQSTSQKPVVRLPLPSADSSGVRQYTVVGLTNPGQIPPDNASRVLMSNTLLLDYGDEG